MEIQDFQTWDHRVHFGIQPALFALGTFACHRFCYKYITPLKASQSVVTTVVNTIFYAHCFHMKHRDSKETYTSIQWGLRSKVFLSCTVLSFLLSTRAYYDTQPWNGLKYVFPPFAPLLKLSSLHFLLSLGVKLSMNQAIYWKEAQDQRVAEAHRRQVEQRLNAEVPFGPEVEAALLAYRGQESHFELDAYPGYIFKSCSRTKYEQIVTAQKICMDKRFSHLVIPHTRYFFIDGKEFIAQQKLNIEQSPDKQEWYYRTYEERLDVAVKELQQYIFEGSPIHVKLENLPILGDPAHQQGELKIALLDLDPCGQSSRCAFENLIGFLGKRQAAKVDKYLYKQGEYFAGNVVYDEDYQRRYHNSDHLNRRLEELHTIEQLEIWYQELGETPENPLPLPLNRSVILSRLKKSVQTAYKEGWRTLSLPEELHTEAVKLLKETIREEWAAKLPISDQHKNAVRTVLRYLKSRQEQSFHPPLFQRLSRPQRPRVQGLEWKNDQVFILEQFPDLVFKYVDGARFEKVVEDQSVCIIHQLTHLVVPCTQPLNVEGKNFIVQERVDFDDTPGNQELYYRKFAERLETAVDQLMTYILKTKESDVEWRNCPVWGDPKITQDPLKIALIDHDLKESTMWGILGYSGLNRRGLLGLLGRKQAHKVAEKAKKHFSPQGVERSLEKRTKELDTYKRLRSWYRDKGFTYTYTLAPRNPSSANGWSFLNPLKWGSKNPPTGENLQWFSGNDSDPARAPLKGTDPLGIIQAFNKAIKTPETQEMLDLRLIRCVLITLPSFDPCRVSQDGRVYYSPSPQTYEEKERTYEAKKKQCIDTLKDLKRQKIIFSYEMGPEDPLGSMQSWVVDSPKISFWIQA